MNRSHSRSSIFLMELIAAILFFSLVSALCLRIFIKSSQLSANTRNLNMAVNQTRNVIELMKNAASPSSNRSVSDVSFGDCILKEYPDAKEEASQILICYDEDWQCCPTEMGCYCMEIIQEEENSESLSLCHIRVFDMETEKDTIYSFDLKLHIPAQS